MTGPQEKRTLNETDLLGFPLGVNNNENVEEKEEESSSSVEEPEKEEKEEQEENQESSSSEVEEEMDDEEPDPWKPLCEGRSQRKSNGFWIGEKPKTVPRLPHSIPYYL